MSGVTLNCFENLKMWMSGWYLIGVSAFRSGLLFGGCGVKFGPASPPQCNSHSRNFHTLKTQMTNNKSQKEHLHGIFRNPRLPRFSGHKASPGRVYIHVYTGCFLRSTFSTKMAFSLQFLSGCLIAGNRRVSVEQNTIFLDILGAL